MISYTASGDALMVRTFPEYYPDRKAISDMICRGEVRLTNLETTITDGNCYGSAYSGGTWVSADESVLDDLSALGFNCFGISNNHTMDYSYEGLEQTLEALKHHGLAFAGAGKDRNAAEKAAVISTEGGKTAVISVCSTFNMAAMAGAETPFLPGRPGLNYLRFRPIYEIHPDQMKALQTIEQQTNVNGLKNLHRQQGFELALPEGIYEFGDNWFREVPEDQPCRRTSIANKKDLERITQTVQSYAEQGCKVIVQMHSHEVKTTNDEEADYFMEEFAHACIDAGAAAVVGGGTHQLKGIEIYRNCPVFYSLGNFVFQNALVKKLPADFLEKYGLPLTATAPEAIAARSRTAVRDLAASTPCFRSVIPYFEIGEQGCEKLELSVIELGQKEQGEMRNLPHPASKDVAKEVFDYLTRVSACYGTEFTWEEDRIAVKVKDL